MTELLRDETRAFDTNYFYCDYKELSWQDQTLRHIGEHITKAGYKLVAYEEGDVSEEVVIDQVIPDLALYRTQIINLLDLDVEDIDWDDHVSDEYNVCQSILWAAGMVNRYIEPAEHTPESRHEQLDHHDLVPVVIRLNFAASALAKAHGINLVESQKARMAR